MRKIAVVTGTRAEYGLLYWIIKGIHEDPDLELQLIVTGMHLSFEFGLTVKEIEKDGFPIAERVEMLLSSDTENAIATSMGLGVIGFAKAYERLNPDIIVVLGDRFEIFSAVTVAVPFKIPVVHLHGGEITEGSMDELFRHAITKMSFLHFPAIPLYANRIIQMGEHPEKVYCFGAPGLDAVHKLTLMSKIKLYKALEIPLNKKVGVITFHPATLEKNTATSQFSSLLNIVKNNFDDIYWIFTLPNADTGSRVLIKMVNEFMKNNPAKGKAFASLGQMKYLSVLRHAVVMVGNSSSGIIEAPSFELPVVNIGYRQKGRERAVNVIDVDVVTERWLKVAIEKALSKKFRDSLKGLKNPYGEGNASEKIVAVLKTISLTDDATKRFYMLNSR